MMLGKSPPSWAYFKENHTVVIGNKHQGHFTEPVHQDRLLVADLEANNGEIISFAPMAACSDYSLETPGDVGNCYMK